VSIARWNPKGMRRSGGLQSMGTILKMNRSACVRKRGKSACCAEDEGRTFGVVLQEKAPNSHELLQSKAVVVNVMVKRRDIRSRHVWVGETNVSEPLETHRKFKDDIETRAAD
jgi:hypothetical protein